MSDAVHDERGAGVRADLEKRVHVDLPRVRPEDMVTTQEVVPARDPEGGRNTDMEFMTRNAGW
ncbi:MAG TPA: hypothetical protein VFI44_08615 [Ornithinibacter sp.]|nr:hypothetical protein [Ornithinibacter sp.]